jgi:hypothetical protein
MFFTGSYRFYDLGIMIRTFAVFCYGMMVVYWCISKLPNGQTKRRTTRTFSDVIGTSNLNSVVAQTFH